jgi:hypothetical protein
VKRHDCCHRREPNPEMHTRPRGSLDARLGDRQDSGAGDAVGGEVG